MADGSGPDPERPSGTRAEIRVPAGGQLEVRLPGGPVVELTSEPGSGELVLRPEEPEPVYCSFCGRAAPETWLMVRGPAAACICDNCLVFSLATIAEHTAGAVRLATEDAAGGHATSELTLAGGPFETVRRCPGCGTYTLSPRETGPGSCGRCGLAFSDAAPAQQADPAAGT